MPAAFHLDTVFAALEGLNAAQQEAVETTDGPLVVFAGPGSGKTRVVTRRVTYLIDCRGVPARDILCVTFTKKAAEEMTRRLVASLGPRARDLTVSTFHSLGFRLLRNFAARMDLPADFRVCEDLHRFALLRQARKECGVANREFPVPLLLGYIQGARDALLYPEEAEARATSPQERACARVYTRYFGLLRERDEVDYDDMVMLPARLLESDPDLRSRCADRFPYVQVDEFQDVDQGQYRFLRCLTQPTSNLCVVGDDDQSVYAFRGGDPAFLLRFAEDYPGAHRVILHENYRSPGRVLAGAQGLIRHNPARIDKALASGREPGPPIRVKDLADPAAEAAWIADYLLAEQIAPADAAVLYRTHAQSSAFERAFLARGIPFRIAGGTCFVRRREVKNVLSFLRVVVDPDLRAQTDLGWTGKFVDNAAVLAHLQEMDRLRLSPVGILSQLLDSTRYRQMLADLDDGAERLANLDVLADLCWEHQEALRPRAVATLAGFLDAMDAMGRMSTAEREGVTLMTLHAAKGLEWPVVFLPGLEEGLLPSANAPSDEEERRLLYVGMTRAQEALFLTWCRDRQRGGQRFACSRSRFVAEMPPEALQFLRHPHRAGGTARHPEHGEGTLLAVYETHDPPTARFRPTPRDRGVPRAADGTPGTGPDGTPGTGPDGTPGTGPDAASAAGPELLLPLDTLHVW